MNIATIKFVNKQPIKVINAVINNYCTRVNNESLNSSGFQTTIDHNDVQRHEKSKHLWWNKDGPMKALHSMNKLRVQFIRDGLVNTLHFLESNKNSAKPLKGVKILDVGCGGGILSEPLARLGACVTGLDASSELISIAKEHSEQSNIENIEYINTSIENLALDRCEVYDGVVASEIVEHVNNKDLFVEACIKTLKPGGSVFVTTLNKTNLSWLGGIIVAEYVLRLLPPGTHQWDKFISPHEMSSLLHKYGCKTKLVHGMMYVFINDKWYWTSDTSINYALHAVKKIM